MILESVRKTLESERSRLGAASCTFYIQDPFWPNELRLIAMPGVRFTEPMHGFSFPPHSKRVITEGAPELFCPDARSSEQFREAPGSPLHRIARSKRFLFGDFVEREQVRSSARLLHVVGGRIKAALFVNFDEATDFDDPLVGDIRNLLDKLVSSLPQLNEALRTSEIDALIQAVRMFPPIHADSNTRLSEWNQPLEEYLHSLLDLALSALGVDLDKTFGAVHQYDPKTETLSLMASRGRIKDQRPATTPHSVPAGEGIISWVAIRRKALLVEDYTTSHFKKLRRSTNKGVRSEVAIPIFAGEELLGTLSLASLQPLAFQPTCVRSLWFAVNRAAVAYRLRQQAKISERLKKLSDGLLGLCSEIVDKGTGDLSLDRLAELAAKELHATRCGIWHYNSQTGEFDLTGISSSDFQPKPPGPGGWSNFIRRFQHFVWIDRTGQEAGFVALYWDGKEWNQPSPDQNPPDRINVSVEPSVQSLLGIPIKVRGQFIGIAWLEYETSPQLSSGNELLKLASGFVAYAGLVIEFSQFDLIDKNAVQRVGESLYENLLASGPLKLEGFPKIEGYVKSQPFPSSRIGGDFYAARVIDEQTAGVLVGDGMGHSVTGTLNMLPMLTMFEAFHKESRSAVHLMDKIMGISNKLGVQGTAIYCVFAYIQKRLWLSVTSAGHPSLVILNKNGKTLPFPDENHPASGAMLGAMLKLPLAEQQEELSSGDLIIMFTDGLNLSTREAAAIGLEHSEEDARTIAEAIFREAADKRQREGKTVDDDETVLVIRVRG